MTSIEYRRHDRHDSANLLAYTCRDQQNGIMDQGMGRTLNVSESGILLETYTPLDTVGTISLSIGFQQQVAEIEGKILYCRPDSKGMFQAGISFLEIKEPDLAVLKEFMKKFKGS